VFQNDFWLINEDLVEINETSIENLELDITYEPISMIKWTLLVQMEDSLVRQSVC
jgi:hypothetical protein